MLHKLTGETDTDYTSAHRHTDTSHVQDTPPVVCFKFTNFVFCKFEPGSLLFVLMIIFGGLF